MALGLSFALITTVMWGLLPLALSGVLPVMDPITITWYRFSISAFIALFWYGFGSGSALRTLFSRKHIGWSSLAVLGLVGNYALYILGLKYTNPGAAQILIQIAPLLLLVASVIMFRERFQPLQWLGVAGFSVGMLLFFHLRLRGDTAFDADYGLGAIILIGAAVIWTAYGLAQKKLLSDFHAKDILLLICLGGSVLLLPFAEPTQVAGLSFTELALLLFCGLNTIIAYGAFGLAMTYWEASRVSAVVPLAPLLTLLFTYSFNALWDLGIAAEPLDWLGALGAMMVVAGSALAAMPRKARL